MHLQIKSRAFEDSFTMLRPFIGSSLLFFIVNSFLQSSIFDPFISDAGKRLMEVPVKCVPCLCLFFSFWNNIHSLSKLEEWVPLKRSRCMALGFLFSALGDAGMVYVNHGGLALGIFNFGIAHIFYIRAFGWKNTNVKIGITLSSCDDWCNNLLFVTLHHILASSGFGSGSQLKRHCVLRSCVWSGLFCHLRQYNCSGPVCICHTLRLGSNYAFVLRGTGFNCVGGREPSLDKEFREKKMTEV
ncbi:lysoplasmalogenase TMEM86A-like isoform X2 [Convolutriloba macropyga]|uniref:lysoplasmalogenase TMEM86A-like isoform X2 n=1 Tax=Convolutriloba macropyga TaxID=536237 RepID=UPI003F5278B2